MIVLLRWKVEPLMRFHDYIHTRRSNGFQKFQRKLLWLKENTTELGRHSVKIFKWIYCDVTRITLYNGEKQCLCHAKYFLFVRTSSFTVSQQKKKKRQIGRENEKLKCEMGENIRKKRGRNQNLGSYTNLWMYEWENSQNSLAQSQILYFSLIKCSPSPSMLYRFTHIIFAYFRQL